MAKKKKQFTDESLLDTKESTEEVVEEKEKEPSRLKVTSNRTYIFSRPDLTSRSIAAVNFGNILFLLEEVEEDFLKVRVPLSKEVVVGFIRKTKVKRI